MTDQQILTLAIAIVFPLAAVIYSNSRVGDVNKRIDDLRSHLGSRLDDSNHNLADAKSEILRHLNGIQSDLKEFFRIQADLDKRVQRLEDKK